MQNKMNRNLLAQSLGLEDVENPQLDPAITLPQLQDQADAPLFVQPSELQTTEVSDLVPMPTPALRNIIPTQPSIKKQTTEAKNVETTQNAFMENPVKFEEDEDNSNPEMSAKMKLLGEYQAMRDKDINLLNDARTRDDYRDLAGVLGNTLATALNAKSQMNVKAPNVNVASDYGVLQSANLFNEAPNVQNDTMLRRKELLDMYRQLSIDENAKLKRDVDLARIEAYKKQIEKMGTKNNEITPYQQAMLDLQRDKLGQQKELRSRDQDFKESEKQELSDKQVESVGSFDKVESILNDIEERAPKFFDKIGPYSSRMETAKNYIPGSGSEDPEFAAFRSTVSDQLAQYIKSISGATVTDAERANLLKVVPNVEDKPEVFMSKLKEVKSRLGKYRGVELGAYKKFQGKKTEQASPSLSPKDQQALDWANSNPDDPRSAMIKQKLGK